MEIIAEAQVCAPGRFSGTRLHASCSKPCYNRRFCYISHIFYEIDAFLNNPVSLHVSGLGGSRDFIIGFSFFAITMTVSFF